MSGNDVNFIQRSKAADYFSTRGFTLQHDLSPPPLDAHEWRRIALAAASTALVARLVESDVVLLMLGEELRRWREDDCPSVEIQSVTSTRTPGSPPRRLGWRDTFDVNSVNEASGYLSLAHPAAKLLQGDQLDLEEEAHWRDAGEDFWYAERDEAHNAPERDRPFGAASGGCPSLPRQAALDRVRRFLTGNQHIVERLTAALLSDTRLTVLESHEIERLISEPWA